MSDHLLNQFWETTMNRSQVVTPKQFAKAEMKYYPLTHNMFRDVAKMALHPTTSVVDLCCGPGTLTRAMMDAGVNIVCAVDISPEFVGEAQDLDIPASVGDVLDMKKWARFDGYGAATMFNATGYFNFMEMQKILKEIRVNRFIANFFLDDDQHMKTFPPYRRRRGMDYFFDIGFELELKAMKRDVLFKILRQEGWKVEAQIMYCDFKIERLLVLERE